MKPLNPTPRQKEKTLVLLSSQLDRKPEVRIDFTRQIASRYLDIAPILKHHRKEAFGFDPGPRPAFCDYKKGHNESF